MTLSFPKIYRSLYSFFELKLLWCERDKWREMKTDCYIDPWLFLLLTISCCFIFRASLSSSSASWRLAVGRCLSEAPSHSLALSLIDQISSATSWDWLKTDWASAYIISSHPHISVKSCGNLLSFLLRCGTRPYERITQWDSNSLM